MTILHALSHLASCHSSTSGRSQGLAEYSFHGYLEFSQLSTSRTTTTTSSTTNVVRRHRCRFSVAGLAGALGRCERTRHTRRISHGHDLDRFRDWKSDKERRDATSTMSTWRATAGMTLGGKKSKDSQRCLIPHNHLGLCPMWKYQRRLTLISILLIFYLFLVLRIRKIKSKLTRD